MTRNEDGTQSNESDGDLDSDDADFPLDDRHKMQFVPNTMLKVDAVIESIDEIRKSCRLSR